ncbi:MAG TPA: hypothetical protein VEO53_09755, partial [Candidatus Binatia bacterium]|nr:hypothetical protein [Candidatus Binatia bacterium]
CHPNAAAPALPGHPTKNFTEFQRQQRHRDKVRRAFPMLADDMRRCLRRMRNRFVASAINVMLTGRAIVGA